MNNIEDAIKRCKELIKPEHSNWIGLTNQSAIKIVLGNLEALADMQRTTNIELDNAKKINEEHKRENGELIKKVKQLEEINRIFALEGSKIALELYIKENYISKQKIKDAIEKIAEYKIARETNKGYYYDYFINQDYKEDFIKLFNQLLEDK